MYTIHNFILKNPNQADSKSLTRTDRDSIVASTPDCTKVEIRKEKYKQTYDIKYEHII